MAPVSITILEDAPIPENGLRELSKTIPEVVSQVLSDDQNGKPQDIRRMFAVLLDTLDSTKISASHRTAACNVACPLIETCYQSKNDLASIVAIHDLWMRILRIYIHRSNHAKAKSMRQLLSLMLSLSKREETAGREALISKAINQLMSFVLNGQSLPEVKASFHCLSFFMSREMVNATQLAKAAAAIALNTSSDELDHAFHASHEQVLLQGIFQWLHLQDAASAAGQLGCACIRDIATKWPKDRESMASMLARPFVWYSKSFPDALAGLQNYVFPTLLQLDIVFVLTLLNSWGLQSFLAGRLGFSHEHVQGLSDSNPDVANASLLFAILQTAKECGVVREVVLPRSTPAIVQDKSLLISVRSFRNLLYSSSSASRLAALSLLISSASTTRPFTSAALQCLQHALPILQADADTEFRGQLLGYVQRMMDRIRACTAHLAKQALARQAPNSAATTDYTPAESLEMHRKFLVDYCSSLMRDLRPTATYQRHIVSLKILQIILRSGIDESVPPFALAKAALSAVPWRIHICVLDRNTWRAFLDLLFDPYDDVRNEALALAKIQSASSATNEQPDAYTQELSNALKVLSRRGEELMVQSGRADHADGLARVYDLFVNPLVPKNQVTQNLAPNGVQSICGNGALIWKTLLSRLEDSIQKAKNDLPAAVSSSPMHGTLESLRYALSDIHSFGGTTHQPSGPREDLLLLLSLMDQLWQAVRHVLCDDAPEGYVLDDTPDSADIDSKSLLSFSWRALKEASLLIRTLVSQARLKPGQESTLISVKEVIGLCNLSFTQLEHLRHRGAFSTVAQTYTICCEKLMTAGDPGCQFVESLYQRTLNAVRRHGTMTTRRSAGLPSLMIGTLNADIEGALFTKTMIDLEHEVRHAKASTEHVADSPPVHALNCLREIFRTTRLSEKSEKYIGLGLELAADSLTSDSWAIRNCGLMLLRALVDRLLGTNTSHEWTGLRPTGFRQPYDKYPGLLKAIHQLLPSRAVPDTAVTRNHESVFAALLLLQWAPPSPQDCESIRQDVLMLTGSRQWQLRDLAARTFCSISSPSDLPAIFDILLSREVSSQNELHGHLLIGLYTAKVLERLLKTLGDTSFDSSLVKSQQSIMQGAVALQQSLTKRYVRLLLQNPCPMTRATYNDIMNTTKKLPFLTGSHTSRKTNVHTRELSFQPGESKLFQRDIGPLSLIRRSQVVRELLKLLDAANSEALEIPDADRTIESNLSAIGDHDADAVFEGLTWFRGFLESGSGIHCSTQVRQRLIDVILGLFQNHDGIEWRTHLWPILAHCIRTSGDISPHHSRQLSALGIHRSYILGNLPDPTSTEALLSIIGVATELRLNGVVDCSKKTNRDLSQLLRYVRTMIDEGQCFTTRRLAIIALRGSGSLWKLLQTKKANDTVLLEYCLLVYDALNDDDEEVRDEAVRVAAPVLATTLGGHIDSDLVPQVASQRLCACLVQLFGRSPSLAVEAFRRLENFPNHDLAEHFRLLIRGNEDLFAIEKQNLFIDPVMDQHRWAQILLLMSSQVCDANTLAIAHAICLVGLQALLVTAETNEDGPLGWTGNPEIYAVGIQILVLAKVLVTWNASNTSDLIRILLQLLKLFEETSVNHAWISLTTDILVLRAQQQVIGICHYLKPYVPSEHLG